MARWSSGSPSIRMSAASQKLAPGRPVLAQEPFEAGLLGVAKRIERPRVARERRRVATT